MELDDFLETLVQSKLILAQPLVEEDIPLPRLQLADVRVLSAVSW
jgi:hypothetical protein